MFIVKPDLDEEQVSAATDKVHQLVVANGGTVTKTASWGKRRLAYQVGQFKEGHYVVSNFDLEPDKITEVERVIKLSDTVFRHLLVRRERPVTGPTEVVVPEMGEADEPGASGSVPEELLVEADNIEAEAEAAAAAPKGEDQA
jgi:small subunit ribosomal protein S6